MGDTGGISRTRGWRECGWGKGMKEDLIPNFSLSALGSDGDISEVDKPQNGTGWFGGWYACSSLMWWQWGRRVVALGKGERFESRLFIFVFFLCLPVFILSVFSFQKCSVLRQLQSHHVILESIQIYIKKWKKYGNKMTKTKTLFNILKMLIWERERERERERASDMGKGQRKWERENPKHRESLSCQHRALCGARSHKL